MTEESYNLHLWYLLLLPETLCYCTELQLFLLTLPLLPKNICLELTTTPSNIYHPKSSIYVFMSR